MQLNEIKKEILKRNPKIETQIKRDLAFQVGRMLTNARLMRGMTQKTLAKKTGTKQPAIARAESGSTLPNLSFLDKIAKKAFGSYLIPPRFAFLSPENAFTENLVNQENQITGNLIESKVMIGDFNFPYLHVLTSNDVSSRLIINR